MTERDPDTIGEPWRIVSEKNEERMTDSLHKMRVPGGYLYRSTIATIHGITQQMCFIPIDYGVLKS